MSRRWVTIGHPDDGKTPCKIPADEYDEKIHGKQLAETEVVGTVEDSDTGEDGTPVEAVFSDRTLELVRAGGYTTVEQLATLHAGDLLVIDGVGDATADAILSAARETLTRKLGD